MRSPPAPTRRWQRAVTPSSPTGSARHAATASSTPFAASGRVSSASGATMADAPVERRERTLEGGDTLRPAQREAVDAPGSVAVVAGAGTGKTHMLAHRFLKHVEDGLDPLEIVAVTFTERAAAELRARIRALLAVSLPPGARARLT